MINYASTPIKIEIESEDEKKAYQEMPAAQYIVLSIQNDEVKFENVNYQEVFNFCAEQLNNNKIPQHNDFTQHQNPIISQFAIDVLTSKYDVSENWAKHGVFPVGEEELLSVGVINTVDGFKLSKVNQTILALQEEFKLETSEEKHLEMMKTLIHYQTLKKILAEKLGRIILK